MPYEEPMNAADRELEAALGQLLPRPAAVNRDAVIFRAGQMSERRKLRTWKGVSALLVAMLGTSVFIRPHPQVTYVAQDTQPKLQQEIVVTALPQQPPPPAAEPQYLALRQAVLDRGLRALPPNRDSSRAYGSQPLMGLPNEDLEDSGIFLFGLNRKRGQL